MSDEKTKDELAVLFPGEDVPVHLRGKGIENVRVEPLYALQFTLAIAKVRPLAKAISRIASIETGANGEQLMRLRVDGDFSQFFEALVESAEGGLNALIDLLAVVLRKPREFFEDVDLEGLFLLTKAAFEQNRSFFDKRLKPLLGAWLPGANKAGAPSTPASSEPATPETASTE